MKWVWALLLTVGIVVFGVLVSERMDVTDPSSIILPFPDADPVPIPAPQPIPDPAPVDPGPQPIPPPDDGVPPPPVDPAPQPTTYTVVSGDCLWTIAKRFYGSGIKYREIYVVNREIVDPDLIYPGQVLFIPG